MGPSLGPILWFGLLLGLFAPSGYMPSFGPACLSITICSGTGGHQAFIPRTDPLYDQLSALNAASGKGGVPADTEDRSAKAGCAFAGGIGTGILGDMWVAPVRIAHAIVSPAIVNSVARARHRAATPPATGPPLLA